MSSFQFSTSPRQVPARGPERDSGAATVLVVEDDPDWTSLLSGVLREAGFAVEGFASPAALLARWPLPERGCLLLDLHLPGMSGLELHRELRRRGLGLPVIVMTAFGDVRVAVEAMRDGAFDFLEKPDVVHEVAGRVAAAIAAREQRAADTVHAEARAKVETLSSREREVFELIAFGLTNKQIASRLELSVKTVELHRGHLMAKTGVGSLAELVRLAVAAGIGPEIGR